MPQGELKPAAGVRIIYFFSVKVF